MSLLFGIDRDQVTILDGQGRIANPVAFDAGIKVRQSMPGSAPRLRK